MLLDYFFTESVAPVVTPVGGHYVDEHKKKLKAHQRAIEAREKEKLAEAKELRKQIELAAGIRQEEIEILPDTVNARDLLSGETPSLYDPTPQLQAKLFELQRELLTIAEEYKHLQQLQQDEEDMEMILNLMNAEIKKIIIH